MSQYFIFCTLVVLILIIPSMLGYQGVVTTTLRFLGVSLELTVDGRDTDDYQKP